MSLIKYDPFFSPSLLKLNTLGENLLDDFFGKGLSSKLSDKFESEAWLPAADIKEDEAKYYVHVDLPGIEPKDVDVTLEGNVLTLKGERKSEKKCDNEKCHRVERSYGSFTRSFTLPESIDSDNIKASGKNGVLDIEIPKKTEKKAKKISVN